MLSTPKSSGYPPRTHLSVKVPGQPQNGWIPSKHSPSPLSSLVSSAPSSLRSLCGVGICREKSKTKMPTIKSQCFETQDSWRTEGLFLDMQVPLQFWCRGRDDALNRVLLVPLCRATSLVSTVGSLRAGMSLFSRGPGQVVT